MYLPSLYSNRSLGDRIFIRDVCNWVLNQEIPEKEAKIDNNWAFIFVEGRANMNFDTIEHNAMWHSCRAFEKYKYPIFCFVNDIDSLNNSGLVEKYNLTVIKIKELNSLEEYTKFCIDKLYFLLPENIQNIITIQADGMLLRAGFEDYCINSNCDWLSPHWKHLARIEGYNKIDEKWAVLTKPTAIGNGGFSYRKAPQMRDISNLCSKLTLREFGREDNRIPMEDLFFTGFMSIFDNFKMPTLKQCDEFAVDPLTLDIWNNKEKLPFGFHYWKTIPDFLPCNHE